MKTRLSVLASSCVMATALAACSGGSSNGGDGGSSGSDQAATHDVSAVTQVQHLAPFSAPRLAAGLVPPTNKWFSGLVFGAKPQPVFPLPISFTMGTNTFGVGLPQVNASAKSIVGSSQADVTMTVQGASAQKVSAYDDASVTISATGSDGTESGRTVVANGSPFVTHTAAKAEKLGSSVAWTKVGDAYQATTPTGTYGMTVTKGSADGRSVSLDQGGSAVVFPVPKGKSVGDLAPFANPLRSTRASYAIDGNTVKTTLAYTTEGDKASAAVANPVQRKGMDAGACSLGSYPTIFGSLQLCGGKELSWSVPKQDAVAGLDVSKLTDQQKTTLRPLVTADVQAIPSPPADTYYGGKWLYRTSQLMLLARGLGLEDDAKKAQTLLTNQLEKWAEPKGCDSRDSFCFVYDSVWKGMVGKTVTFGADAFNDHHFHYGYFLYAAGVLASVDQDAAKKVKPVVDLLAADIASQDGGKEFPRLRSFDPYSSHSWASGVSPFADGNNQESSSEAVNAWAGLQLWAKATKQDGLEKEGVWLMSSEAAAAQDEWVAPDLSDPSLKGYTTPYVGITWGNKRDDLTWFSSTPQAVLGIQMIPMSPSHAGYLSSAGASTIAKGFDAATTNGGTSVPLGDYLLMYSALGGKAQAEKALTQAQALPDSSLDNGNSRSYMTAFIMAAEAR